MRVWSFARELICELSYLGIYLNRNEISLLMLSVFFHDTGLTQTLDEDHGWQSRKLCEIFLEENSAIFNYDTTIALNAIEQHDKKKEHALNENISDRSLLKILTICDDLDAFGLRGIFRYAEIYLLRGISEKTLSNKVLQNLELRLEAFSSQLWIPAPIKSRHINRYKETFTFYESMSRTNQGNEFEAQTSIINKYMEEVYYGRSDFDQFAGNLANDPDTYKAKFGSSLLAELNDNFLTCT
jgi:hypothetical protein